MDVGITRLINAAQLHVARGRLGQVPTTAILDSMASEVRDVILAQVAGGLWAPWNAHEVADLAPLRVTARFGNRLIGEPMIKFVYDWTRTTLARVVVDNRSAN